MKKQSGFTLIELLLVLAIIGIISAIAIPALLGQRARARDKSAISNCDSIVADMVGQWDKGREAGSTVANIISHIGSYVAKAHSNDKNPWDASAQAYTATVTSVAGATTGSGFAALMAAPSAKGQVDMYMQTPSAGGPGFAGAVVGVNNPVNSSSNYRKLTAIE
jgi:prepilin-type N-terminal cleavage/methylation domain-containing protein